MLDLDPERALLGVALATARFPDDLDVAPEDFANPRHEALWSLLTWLDSQRMPTDPVTVMRHLARVTLPGVDGAWLADLVTGAPIRSLARHYGALVTEKATLRRLIAAGERIVQLAKAGENSQEVAEMARKEVDASSRAIASVSMINDEIDMTLTAFEEAAPIAIPTPWQELNYLIQGWRPGALYVIGARPGIGKSLMALQAAIGLAKCGYVAFHSLEMPRLEVHTRIIAQLASVPQSRMDDRHLSTDDWRRIAGARAAFADLHLAIDDRSSIRPLDIRSHARTLARRGPLVGIAVDYLQLMAGERGERRPRHEQVADWSRSLKILAKEMNVPVIAVSQLNRQVEGRQDKRPTMSDLRESGSLEQDADVVLLLHVDEENDPSTMHVLVAKNRQGSTGTLKLTRKGEIARLDAPSWAPSRAAGVA
ncbi:MAG: AAA family ATPase [Actinomycetales bacterium]|nr:AAA family ATPase [Actinomycetales bacterium]